MWTPFDALAQKEGEQSRRSAEKKNQALLDAWNKDMFRYQDESRGSTGLNAVLLRNPELAGAESLMAGDVMDYYNAANRFYGTPDQRLARFASAADSTSASRQGAVDAVGDIYSGALTDKRLASVAPVLQARTNLAATGRQGVTQALMERLNALQTAERRKGYTGSGSFAQNRMLGATMGANQMAAAMEAQAALDNAAQVYGIEDATRQLGLSSVNLPYQLAQAEAQMAGLPVAATGQSYLAQQAPFSMFNTGYIAPPYNALQGPVMRAPKKTGTQILYEGLHEGTNDAIDLAMAYFSGGTSMLGGGMGNNQASTAGAPAGTTTVGGKSYAPGAAPMWGGF